ncbi:hypothetical protein [Actinomadura sp. 9N407]|uniref:hypothetical protein n=1 Tax=Actinomadura sp. 9N407 TaxID=3375154 RepID=UPI003793ED75
MSPTSRRLARHTHLTPASATAGIACVALFAMGCSGEPAKANLPAEPGPQSPSKSSSDSEAVKDSYLKFVKTLERADTLPEATRKRELSTYMVDPQLSRVLKVIEQHRDDHLATYGSVVIRIKDVQVDGSKATVRDCQDASRAGLLNTETRKKINRGFKERNTQALMEKGADGHWRVSKFIELGEGC